MRTDTKDPAPEATTFTSPAPASRRGAGKSRMRVFCGSSRRFGRPAGFLRENLRELGTAVPNSPYYGTHSATPQETKRMALLSPQPLPDRVALMEEPVSWHPTLITLL
jgi:hypothetical protein